MKIEQKVLIDADVVSHFLTASQIQILPKIFPLQFFILDIVYEELKLFKRKKKEIDNLIQFKILNVLKFPENNREIRKEYLYLKNKEFRGAGESACMAMARFNNDIIGSSNLKDIAEYCKKYKIKFLTTLDFIFYAVEYELLTRSDADDFINKLHEANHRIPKKVQSYSDIKPRPNPLK